MEIAYKRQTGDSHSLYALMCSDVGLACSHDGDIVGKYSMITAITSYEDVKQTLNRVIFYIQARRLTYLCHVSRMSAVRLPHIVLCGHNPRSRIRGRHRKKWLISVKEACVAMKVTLMKATVDLRKRLKESCDVAGEKLYEWQRA